MEKIGLEAVFQDKDFQAGMARYVSGLSKAEGATQKTAGVMTNFGHTISTAIGTAIGNLVSQGIPALISGLGSFITEAAAAEQGDAALEAVLKSTKGVAGVTADAVNGIANALSEMTPFEDDAIKSGQSLLLTFTNIGKNVFPDATEVMLDMSQALGQDLKSSAIQLGKALQDPTQGVSALQRVGVNFTDSQKKMIEQMVKAGKTEQAQRFILKELQTEFGGAAKAAGTTFAGQLKILSNQFGNIKEEIGTALLPILKNMTNFISRNILPIVKRFTSEYMPRIVMMLEGIGQAFQQLFGSLAAGDLDSAVAGFTAMLLQAIGVSEDFAIAAGDAFAGIAKGIQDIVKGFQTGGLSGGLQAIGTQLANAFKNVDWTKVTKDLDKLKTQFWDWLTGKGGVLETVGTELNKVITAIKDWLSNEANTKPIVTAVMGWVDQFWTWLTEPTSGIIATVATKMGELTKTIKDWSELETTKQQFRDIGKTIAKTILDGIGRLFEDPSEGRNLLSVLADTMRTAYENLRQTFANIGSDIAHGFIEDIATGIWNAETASRLANAMDGAFHAMFDVLSTPGGPIMGLGQRLAQAVFDSLVTAWNAIYTSWRNSLLGQALGAAPATPPLPWGGTGEKFQGGGWVHRTGMAKVDVGEYVLNRQQAMQFAPMLTSPNNSRTYNFYHTWPAGVPTSQQQWTEGMVRRVTQQEMRGILGKG